MDLALLGQSLGIERKARLSSLEAEKHCGRYPSNFGAVLETVARTAPDKQDVGEMGMMINQEVAVSSIFILADAAFDERRFLQQREPAITKGDYFGQRQLGRHAALRIGVDLNAVSVVGKLYTAPF